MLFSAMLVEKGYCSYQGLHNKTLKSKSVLLKKAAHIAKRAKCHTFTGKPGNKPQLPLGE